ncbi:MAG: 30S ribosome-binding factor RbfA [Holosporaceae bacterium]|jgi:ribosome-binding factor A|nr:30S ribosome-binding factor RbfA [Holosporaceae bacterium]
MRRKNCNRSQRVAEEVRRVLSEYLLSDPFMRSSVDPALLSITAVTISPCLQHAKVYVAPLSPDIGGEDCLIFLRSHSSQLRYHIGSSLRLKFVPDLSFFLDDSFDCALRINSLLKARDNVSGSL